MNKRYTLGFTPIIVLLIILVLGTVGYFVYKGGAMKLGGQVTPIQPTPSPTIDPTANWTKYGIETLKITFKLPQDLSKYGDLIQSESPSETGSELCWTFPQTKSMFLFEVKAGGGPCSANHFGIAATTLDHSAGRSGGFADMKLFQVPESIPASAIKSFTNQYGIKIIRIVGGEYPKEPGDPWEGPSYYFGDLETGHVGALVQYDEPNYNTVTVHIILSDDLTIDTFDQILSTFKFNN